MAKLIGWLTTDRSSLKRLSSRAVHSNLGTSTRKAYTTVDEDGNVSLRIEVNGKVAYSIHVSREDQDRLLEERP